MDQSQAQAVQKPMPMNFSPASDEQIIAYLHRSHQFAAVAAAAEREAVIVNLCEQLNITVSEEEMQLAGDAFRLEHKLLSVSDMLVWLTQQRISVEEWTEGIRLKLLADQLKEYCFGRAVDNHYLSNREHYRRVALSQILVRDLSTATQLADRISQENASFSGMAVEYSQSQPSKDHGGFMGILFISELLPEIGQAISQIRENEVIGPVGTKLGYHILRVEKWFPIELDETTRKKIMEALFQRWLEEL